MSFTPQQAQAFEEAAKRFSRGLLTLPPVPENRLGAERLTRTLTGLTVQQMAIHDCGHKRIALHCTRRAGKSYLAAPWLVENGMTATQPGTTMFFIAPTLEHAKALLWPQFQRIKRETNLEFELKGDPARIEFPSGATLYFRGAKDADQLGPLTGFAVRKVWVDECQDIKSEMLRSIDEKLSASLRDLDGDMIWSGTSGKIAAGKWWEVTTGQPVNGKPSNWKTFTWSLFENPHLSERARSIEAICEDEGLTIDSPRFKREYQALWVEDDSAFVYKYDIVRNGKHSATAVLDAEYEWQYLMGVDFGYSPDPSAVVILAYSNTHPIAYVVDEWCEGERTYADLYTQGIKPFLDKYGPMPMVADNAAKQGIAELNQRWGLGLRKSEKMDKLTWIELLNSDLVKGTLQVPPEFKLAKEMAELVWDPAKYPDRKEHPRRSNHCCDALLYAWRYARNWLQIEKATELTFNTGAEREAYHLKRYINERHLQDVDGGRDWANDANFSGYHGDSELG